MSDPDGFTTGQQIGGGVAAFLTGIFSVQAWKQWLRPPAPSARNGSDTDKIVGAINQLRDALLEDGRQRHRSMHERFNEVDEKLQSAEVERAMFVAATNERWRNRRNGNE